MSDLLKKYASLDNICPELDEDKLLKIGQNVLLGYEEDLKSSQEWLDEVKKVEELVSLVSKKKTRPLPNSANIKYPLITKACIEFSSRTAPEIVRDGKVVKGHVLGKDIDGTKFEQAERVCDYMNYQLMFENPDWQLSLEKLLYQLALVGFVCKKSYYDPIKDQIKSELCEYKDLIINSSVICLEDAPRISHIIKVRLNDLISAVRSDLFNKEPVDELMETLSDKDLNPEIVLIEQHTFLDLDEDDYAEPYIVTSLKDNGKVLRIAPRFISKDIKIKNSKVRLIKPQHYFTDFHFLVSPKGKFQSVGFGILMLHLNESINTLMNQLTDAGQLANMQSGYIDARLKEVEGDGSDLAPGEWRRMKAMAGVTLKEGVMPIVYKEPSNVLFSMLGMIIDSSKELANSTELMNGASSPENAKSGAVMAMIDQGLKMFTAIQNRVYRSLTNEYRKIFTLNRLYLDPQKYINVVDDELAVFQKDFDEDRVDILPVADPNLSSEVQRIARYQVLLQLINLPGMKPDMVTKRLVQALNIPNPDELLFSDQEKAKQPPPFEVVKLQSEMEGNAHELELKNRAADQKDKELALKAAEVQCNLLVMKSTAILNLAKAEAAEAGTQMQDYQNQMDMLYKQIDVTMELGKQTHERLIQQEDMQHQKEMQAQEIASQPAEVLGPDGQATS